MQEVIHIMKLNCIIQCFVAFYWVHLQVDILNIRKYMAWVTLKKAVQKFQTWQIYRDQKTWMTFVGKCRVGEGWIQISFHFVLTCNYCLQLLQQYLWQEVILHDNKSATVARHQQTVYINTLRTGDAGLHFYITTVQDGWRKSAFLTRACFPCTIYLIMQYTEPVSEWSCWRMFIETWPHSELTFRHRASSI